MADAHGGRSSVSESPWTVQIVKDANDSKKVWFHNLFARESLANESTRFYGIVDEEQGTIEIPFGQQTAYLYQGDSPIVLYWLDADNQYGKDGACTVTILKDAFHLAIGGNPVGGWPS